MNIYSTNVLLIKKAHKLHKLTHGEKSLYFYGPLSMEKEKATKNHSPEFTFKHFGSPNVTLIAWLSIWMNIAVWQANEW